MVIAYALKYDIDDERLARALILSNLVAIHIKHYLGKLSALCGCVVASTGSSCGIVYLQGGGYDAICAAIKNMAGNITGMVCDGAKVGCAMKVASGVSCAVQSAVLALRGTCIPSTDGIIDDDVEKKDHPERGRHRLRGHEACRPDDHGYYVMQIKRIPA